MRIAIFGAGAIGGLVGARLALAGADVTLIARGAHLAAIRTRGLTLVRGRKTQTVIVTATDDASGVAPFDVVVVTLKANAFSAAAPAIARLLAPGSFVVPAINGIPYWYFHGVSSPYRGRRLASVDPEGAIERHLPPERALGCVVYPAAEIVEPGVIRHIEGDRFTLGEPDGTRSARAASFAELMGRASFRARISDHVRDEVWLKLLGNLAFNPLSVLSGDTLERIAADPDQSAIAAKMMREAEGVAQALGVSIPLSIEKRIAAARDVGAHKTSMLQDYERGRELELDALLGAVVELGDLVSSDVTTCRRVLDAVRVRAASRT